IFSTDASYSEDAPASPQLSRQFPFSSRIGQEPQSQQQQKQQQQQQQQQLRSRLSVPRLLTPENSFESGDDLASPIDPESSAAAAAASAAADDDAVAEVSPAKERSRGSFGSRLKRKLSPRWKKAVPRPRGQSYLYSDLPQYDSDFEPLHQPTPQGGSRAQHLNGSIKQRILCLKGEPSREDLFAQRRAQYSKTPSSSDLHARMAEPLLFAQSQLWRAASKSGQKSIEAMPGISMWLPLHAMAVAGIHRPAPAPPAESPTIIPPTPPPGSSSVRRPAAAGASAAAKSTYSSPGGKRRQLPPTPPGARAPPPIFIPQPQQQQQPQQPMPSVLPHTMPNGFAGNGPVRGLQRGIQRQDKVDLPSDIRQDYYPTDQFRFAAPDAYAQLGMHHAANAAPGGSFDFDEQNAFDDLNDEDYFDGEPMKVDWIQARFDRLQHELAE
uniref:PAT1 domain-containing protein n=1 Tax=Macrostomum lignano TaxID=282301 RepID=A0A1I8HWX7_9PLAT